jgi:hypothetical protein
VLRNSAASMGTGCAPGPDNPQFFFAALHEAPDVAIAMIALLISVCDTKSGTEPAKRCLFPLFVAFVSLWFLPDRHRIGINIASRATLRKASLLMEPWRLSPLPIQINSIGV